MIEPKGECLHWANVSNDQIDRWSASYGKGQVALLYITAMLRSSQVAFWLIPVSQVSAVLKNAVETCGKHAKTHIKRDGSKDVFLDPGNPAVRVDVSSCKQVIRLTEDELRTIRQLRA